MTHHHLPRLGFLRLALLFALLLGANPGRAQTADLSLGSEWGEAVRTLRGLPVQDTGFIRSGQSFAENLISAISGKRQLGRTEALESVLYLLRDPHAAHGLPLIKISHPDLVEIYGTSQITAQQWRDMAYRERLLAFLAIDEETRLRPLNSIEYRAQLLENIGREFAIFPRDGEWLSPSEARRLDELSPADARILEQWDFLHQALRSNDPETGSAASRELLDAVKAAAAMEGQSLPPLGLDLFYHSHQPFRNAAAFYLVSALLFAAGLLLGMKKLAWGGYACLLIGFLEHLLGVGIFWQLSGRLPLSNMWESFVFAVGGMVLIGLILEGFRVVKLAGLGAAILGFIFMVIAHKLPIFDSQIRPLMPALQSSWLTYHVVTIMLSYSAFALSFFVALLYLAKDKALGGDQGTGLLARKLPSLRSLDVFNYRIIAIGFPLLTIGIVAGAVWAATAWGRPWGFDPKETWSAITWLVYAIYLHARFVAGWGGRVAAIIAIVGFACVLFTYFGVNYLLAGLHSYV